MIKSIYSGVKACVKISSGCSESLSCPFGVRQGCSLSLVFFSPFLNDIKGFEGSYVFDLDVCKRFVLLCADD